MKRKLDEDDVPVPETTDNEHEAPQSLGFDTLGLDARLLQAIAKLNFSTPTLVQAKTVPLALAGKDILARSQTGSGKTAAYLLPILQSLLQRKAIRPNEKIIAALILVPTRELAQQTSKVIVSFTSYCASDVRTVDLAQKVAGTVKRTWLAESPDIVVATPASAIKGISDSDLSLDQLEHLVIDEADLVLSYGYDEDLQVISNAIPKGVQTTLMSATLSTDLDVLKGLFCQDPVAIDLQETTSDLSRVTQYTVKCSENDKFLLVYVIFKLSLIKGKCIIFVEDIDKCYRVKLVLEQFGIRSCVLNSELPVNSRMHIVEEFNKGVYNIIIASDEHEVIGERVATKKYPSAADTSAAEVNGETDDSRDIVQEVDGGPVQNKRKKKAKKSKEYGISRGIDFQNVAAVLNFDFPTSPNSYTHRIGRTARAGKIGLALSFIVPKTLYNKHKATTFPTAEQDELVLEQVHRQETRKGRKLEPYNFDERQLSAFRYRMNDALRAVTRVAIREARMTELKQELLKSERLKRHFEENPEDLRGLRHDGELRAARVQPHLKHVPDYLIPFKSGTQQGLSGGKEIGFAGLRKETDGRNRRRRKVAKRMATKRADPLKTFNARGRGKK